MLYAVQTVLLDLIAQFALAGLPVAIITGILGLILTFRVRSGVLYTIRLLALVGMGVLGAELYTFAYGAAFVCFDTCPADIPSALLRVFLLLVGPGIALCAVGWLLLLGVAVRGRLWPRALVVGSALPLAVAGALLALWANTGGQILPVTERGISTWGGPFIFGAIPILLCWPLTTLLTSVRLRSPVLPAPDAGQATLSLRFLPLVALLALGLDLIVGKALGYRVLGYGAFPWVSPLLFASLQVGTAYLVFLTGLLGLARMRAQSQRKRALLSLGLIAFLVVTPPAFAVLATARRQWIPGWSFEFGAPGWLVAQAAWYLPASALALLSWRSLRPEEGTPSTDAWAGRP